MEQTLVDVLFAFCSTVELDVRALADEVEEEIARAVAPDELIIMVRHSGFEQTAHRGVRRNHARQSVSGCEVWSRLLGQRFAGDWLLATLDEAAVKVARAFALAHWPLRRTVVVRLAATDQVLDHRAVRLTVHDGVFLLEDMVVRGEPFDAVEEYHLWKAVDRCSRPAASIPKALRTLEEWRIVRRRAA